ncbi:bifunctional class I SAM-dependent methyltransferase/NUDIX hydrolase [Pseudonocardia pini]|uniref:bifunctional class I SAM-dependent methyltransferase/NUDIX hydrolase n=1 Tax=Pseudonocardia pini TaxID=2758030 RepID=UPI0015F09484|nr:methyltransferase domain-containing protein [Pseudonocardia pini]
MAEPDEDTTAGSYTDRLNRLQTARWKQVLDVQRPYRWNLRRLLGERRVLDVGCGIGRNLAHLSAESVGVDHNQHSVDACRELGLTAFTTDEFLAAPPERPFDGMLAAHLVEHLPPDGAAEILRPYLPSLAPGARVVLICPQERGYASDATHTVFFDHARLRELAEELGLEVSEERSFPFPRAAGRVFTYNEFVSVAHVP